MMGREGREGQRFCRRSVAREMDRLFCATGLRLILIARPEYGFNPGRG